MQLNGSLEVVFLQVVITLGGIIFLTIIRYIQKKPQSNPIQCMQCYAAHRFVRPRSSFLSLECEKKQTFPFQFPALPVGLNLNPGVF
jgi:hypothetical protein